MRCLAGDFSYLAANLLYMVVSDDLV